MSLTWLQRADRAVTLHLVRAKDFGVSEDPDDAALEDVLPYRDLTAAERYLKFLDLESFYETIWKSLDPELRARYELAQRELDHPGRWWERVGSP